MDVRRYPQGLMGPEANAIIPVIQAGTTSRTVFNIGNGTMDARA